MEGEGGQQGAHFPQSVTTPRRGPLILTHIMPSGRHPTHRNSDHAPSRYSNAPSRHGHAPFRHGNAPMKHKSSLTRLPVAMICRPLDEIEAELGHLSCTALKENIQLMQVQSSLPFSLSSPSEPLHLTPSLPLICYLTCFLPLNFSLTPSLSLLFGSLPSSLSPFH